LAAAPVFSQDGRSLLLAGGNGTQRLWRLPWLQRQAPAQLALRARAATHLRLAGDGSLESLGYAEWRRAWKRLKEEAP
jgi:hypothetical protein